MDLNASFTVLYPTPTFHVLDLNALFDANILVTKTILIAMKIFCYFKKLAQLLHCTRKRARVLVFILLRNIHVIYLY